MNWREDWPVYLYLGVCAIAVCFLWAMIGWKLAA